MIPMSKIMSKFFLSASRYSQSEFAGFSVFLFLHFQLALAALSVTFKIRYNHQDISILYVFFQNTKKNITPDRFMKKYCKTLIYTQALPKAIKLSLWHLDLWVR